MAIPKFAFLLFNVCTIFFATRGIDLGTITALATIASATAATASASPNVVYGKRPVDQDLNTNHDREGGGGEAGSEGTCESTNEAGQCVAQNQSQTKQQQQQQQQTQKKHSRPNKGKPARPKASFSDPKYKSGDIIELFNTESKDIQIVFPSIVKGKELDTKTNTYIYHVTKTTDGKDVENIPEHFLHMYTPYAKGAEVLCNIGDFKPARPIIVRCTVLDYTPAANRGAMVLQGSYSVQVHATRANEEYTTTLPVWKMQRRYLAGGSI